MLMKCVKARASCLIPDMEDSVPLANKAEAREVVRDHLLYMYENKHQMSGVYPRPNALETGML